VKSIRLNSAAAVFTAIAAAAATTFILPAAPAAAQGMKHDMKMMGGEMPMVARYGGPSYGGAPALAVTASLVAAGGGAENYSTARALTAMVGKDLVTAEMAKLTKQYGAAKVQTWLTVFDFAVKDALKIATKAGVKLPKPTLQGKELAAALVTAGADKDRTFYVEFLLDKVVSNKIHHQVMADIDAQFSPADDGEYHRITNQAMYDLAQALGAKQIKLAEFH